MPLRIINTSDECQTIRAHTVVGIAKPIVAVTNVKLPKFSSDPNSKTQKKEEITYGNF